MLKFSLSSLATRTKTDTESKVKKKKKKNRDKDGEMKDGYTNQDILSQGSIYFTPSQHPIRFHIKEQ